MGSVLYIIIYVCDFSHRRCLRFVFLIITLISSIKLRIDKTDKKMQIVSSTIPSFTESIPDVIDVAINIKNNTHKHITSRFLQQSWFKDFYLILWASYIIKYIIWNLVVLMWSVKKIAIVPPCKQQWLYL